MGTIKVSNLGKAYKVYQGKLARLLEWIFPRGRKRHTVHWVLRNISFTVDSGEAVGIIGVNGAGKSTLLKLITGTTRATEGHHEITGNVAAILELGMGFHPDFTGKENALMAAQLLGIDSREMSVMLPRIEEFADIGDYFDQPLRLYSSGMSVRLAFAVATARRPDVLIIDEALSVGDAYFQQKSFKRIRQFQADGTTLLLVSHDVAAVRSICSKAIWIDQGRIRAKGETKVVLDEYAASIYEKSQDITGATANKETHGSRAENTLPGWRRDARQDFINTTDLRNEIEIFDFDNDASRWGDASALITNVSLVDSNGNQLSWMLGGEEVSLCIEARAMCDITKVVLGFIVRDRLGQSLFGDNTFLSTIEQPLSANNGQHVQAIFRFLMPILPHGSYSVVAAVATGTQEDHVINDWIDQAVTFESHNRGSVSGMIGIPIHNINVSVY